MSDPVFILKVHRLRSSDGGLSGRSQSFISFLSVIHFFGTSFLKLCSFTSVVKRYVCGEIDHIVPAGKRKRLDGEDQSFAREVEGFLFLFPELGDVERGFIDFHNFSLNFGKPMATVLISTQEKCRMWGKALAVDPNFHVVVILSRTAW